MIAPEAIVATLRIARAQESWEPVLLGGMIPILGALAVVWLIRYAIKDPPEHNKDLPPEDPPPPAGPSEDGHEGPLH
jgi:hypothetical protein